MHHHACTDTPPPHPQAFGRELADAGDWLRQYQRTRKASDVSQAWELYHRVFRYINKRLPKSTTLELQQVSPRLLRARDLELAVPGTYQAGEEVVRISSFWPKLQVINSKQRPRKIAMKGSDGGEYVFLLKVRGGGVVAVLGGGWSCARVARTAAAMAATAGGEAEGVACMTRRMTI